MMNDSFESLLQKIQTDLPDLLSPDMLVKLGLASHVKLFHMRRRRELPYIQLSNARILYMKSDVIEFLKKSFYDPASDRLEASVPKEVS
jgi:hypothetical protein